MTTLDRTAFEATKARWLSWAFVLGPLVTAISAGVFVLGIRLNPGRMAWGSSLEGVVGFFGFLLLVPPFLALAGRLGEAKPRLAMVISVLVLLGFGGGAVWNMALRVVIPDLLAVGVTVPMLDQLQANLEAGETSAALAIVTFVGVCCPLSSLLLGIGMLAARIMPRQAALLLLAGIVFPIGQLFGVHGLFYFAAIVLWAVVLVPIGLRRIWAVDPMAQRELAPG